MQADKFHRRTKGTADIDRYRARVLSNRAAVRIDFFEGMSTLARPALAAALLTLILFALVKQNPARNVAATKGRPHHNFIEIRALPKATQAPEPREPPTNRP